MASNLDQHRELLPGLIYRADGDLDLSPQIHSELVSLADRLELEADLPINTEHVAAAVVASVLHGELSVMQPVNWACDQLKSTLLRHIRRFYEDLDGWIDDDSLSPHFDLSPEIV